MEEMAIILMIAVDEFVIVGGGCDDGDSSGDTDVVLDRVTPLLDD